MFTYLYFFSSIFFFSCHLSPCLSSNCCLHRSVSRGIWKSPCAGAFFPPFLLSDMIGFEIFSFVLLSFLQIPPSLFLFLCYKLVLFSWAVILGLFSFFIVYFFWAFNLGLCFLGLFCCVYLLPLGLHSSVCY